MGLSMTDLAEMPWGRLVLMLQAKASTYEKPKPSIREATQDEIDAWF